MKRCLEDGWAYPGGTSPRDIPNTPETGIIVIMVMTREDWRIV
jgi:hypothetical protein